MGRLVQYGQDRLSVILSDGSEGIVLDAVNNVLRNVVISGGVSGTITWGSVTSKPFSTLNSSDFTVVSDELRLLPSGVLSRLNAASGTISDSRLPSTMTGKTFNGDIAFNADELGITTYGDGRFYKKTGTGLVIRRSSGDQDPQVENNAGTNSWKIWHAGNDGAGSGLDADLWQGLSRASYLNQDVRTSASPTFGSLNTGHGYNELYPMNQAVRTSDSPTFVGGTFTGALSANTLRTDTGKFLAPVDYSFRNAGDTAYRNVTMAGITATTGTFSGALSSTTLDTGQGANELYPMNQDVRTSASPTFGSLNTGHGYNELYPMNQAVRTSDNVFFNTVNVGITSDLGYTLGVDGNQGITGLAEHPSFSSGWTGAKAQVNFNTGYAEFDSVFIRGALTLNELIVNKKRAILGDLIISQANGKIKSVTGTAPNETITLEDPDNDGLNPFVANDLVIDQTYKSDAHTILKRLVRKVASVTGMTVTFAAQGDAPSDAGTFAPADSIIQFGNTTDTTRQNILYMSASDTNNPFYDTITGINSWAAFSDVTNIKTRTGNLTGLPDIGVFSPSGYGLYAQNAFLSGTVVADNFTLTAGIDYFKSDKSFSFGGGILNYAGSGNINMAAWEVNSNEVFQGETTAVGTTHVGLRGTSSDTSGAYIYKSGDFSPRGLHIQWWNNSNAGVIGFGELPSDATGNIVTTPAVNGWYGIYAAKYNSTTPYFQLSFDTTSDGTFVSKNSIASFNFDAQKIWTGVGNFGSSDTPLYLGAAGDQFSLANVLQYDKNTGIGTHPAGSLVLGTTAGNFVYIDGYVGFPASSSGTIASWSVNGLLLPNDQHIQIGPSSSVQGSFGYNYVYSGTAYAGINLYSANDMGLLSNADVHIDATDIYLGASINANDRALINRILWNNGSFYAGSVQTTTNHSARLSINLGGAGALTITGTGSGLEINHLTDSDYNFNTGIKIIFVINKSSNTVYWRDRSDPSYGYNIYTPNGSGYTQGAYSTMLLLGDMSVGGDGDWYIQKVS